MNPVVTLDEGATFTRLAVEREPMPRSRRSQTWAVKIQGNGPESGLKLWMAVGFYDDGRIGEVFLRLSKEGSFVRGVAETLGKMLSNALQHGVPARDLADSMVGISYPPFGPTNDPEILNVSSLTDYIGQRMLLILDAQEGQ